MIANRTQISIVMEVIRELLRVRDLRYRDVAERFEVTERTVIRWFTSDTVDSAIIERLCKLVGLTFFEVCELAARRIETRLTRLTVEQEQMLVDEPLLNYLFTFVVKGWSVAELQEEIGVPEPMLVDALIKLEKAGLVDVMPGNDVRLRTARDIQWRINGPYARYMNFFLKWSLDNPDVAEKKSLWMFEPLKLSVGSLALLRRRFDELRKEAVLLAERDRRSNDPTRDWFTLATVARHIVFTPLSEWRTRYRADSGYLSMRN